MDRFYRPNGKNDMKPHPWGYWVRYGDAKFEKEAAIEQARKDGAREAEGRIIRLLEEMRTGLDDCNHLGMAIGRIRSRVAEGKPSGKIARLVWKEGMDWILTNTINQIADYINALIDREGGESPL